MMLACLGQGLITAFANELAVGDNGALITLMCMGINRTIQMGCPITQDTMSGYIQITPKNLDNDINEVTVTLKVPESTYEKLVSPLSMVLQSMTNQRLQKLEMIIKSHFT